MNNHGNLGLIGGILLIGFILIGAVSASVIMTNTENISEPDLNQLTNEAVDEICSYLQIKDVLGKYQTLQGQQQIQKIAFLIRPLVTQDIDLSHLTIQLANEEQLYMLFFNNDASELNSYSLFDHPLWDNIQFGTFSVLSIIDDDESITQNHFINKNTDTAFLLIKLPENCLLKKDETLQATLLPAPGIAKTVTLEAPLPSTHVVSLYEI